MITLGRVVELSDAERAEVQELSLAVYSPAEIENWSGRHLEWSRPEWCVRVRDSAGQLVSYVGIHFGDATHAGRPIQIGGIGNVKTHPDARGRGFATAGINKAVEFFHQQPELEFALLVCEPALLGYYARLGWHEFPGTLLVRQFTKTCEFTFNRIMTIGIRGEGPVGGVIDLDGPPW